MTQYFPENEWQFEALVRDVLQLKYNDPSIQLFGRRGQKQHGIDSASTGQDWIACQCKYRELSQYNNKKALTTELLEHLQKDFDALKSFPCLPKKFIFATTFENDQPLQMLGQKLSNEHCTVEYFSWTEIKAVIEQHRDILLPHYWPDAAPSVMGFERINQYTIEQAKISDSQQRQKLGLSYYKVNDSFGVLLQVVSNDIDVPNEQVLSQAQRRIAQMDDGGSFWIVGNGGCGKSSLMMRLAVQSAEQGFTVFCLDLENPIQGRELNQLLNQLANSFKLARAGKCILLIDNPAANTAALSQIMAKGPMFCESLIVVLVERASRLNELKQEGSGVQISLQGQATQTDIVVQTNKAMRQQVYDNFLDYLAITDVDKRALAADITPLINSKELVFVNATNELKLKWHLKYETKFAFDWDDYQQKLQAAKLDHANQGFEYIALLYLFAIRTPLSLLFELLSLTPPEQQRFISYFDNEANEPLVINSRLNSDFNTDYFARLKHEKTAEHYFLQKPAFSKSLNTQNSSLALCNKAKQYMSLLLIQWIKGLDITDTQVNHILVQIFGYKNKRARLFQWFDADLLWRFWQSDKMKAQLIDLPQLQVACYLNHSWHLLVGRQLQQAADCLVELLQLVPNNLQARTELSKIYQQQKDWEKAVNMLSDLLIISPKNIHAHTELSRIYQRQGLYKQAQNMAQRALEIKSTDSYGMMELIKCLAAQQQFDVMLEYTKIYFSQPQVQSGRNSSFVIEAFLNCCQRYKLADKASLFYKDYREYFSQRNEDQFFKIIKH